MHTVDHASGAPTVSRAQVLAHRVVAQGLDRTGAGVDGLAATDLGWLDSPAGSALQALAARTPDGAGAVVPAGWVLGWSLRGAPHHHRRRDLRALAAALWPADDADATARLGGAAVPHLQEAGLAPLDALRATAEAMAAVVTEPMVKGDASAAVTREAPEACSTWCGRCGAVHVHDQLMRLAALPTGLRLEPGTSPPVLVPVDGWPGLPAGHHGGAALVEAYLRVNGPASPAEVAAFLQATQRAVQDDWPPGLAEVRIEGAGPKPRRAWLPADQLDDLLGAPAPRVVRLLPRTDPWLLARDRELTVPDRDRRKVLWPALGAPGGVLVDGEIVGAWRSRAAGRRLDVTVRPFEPLGDRRRRAIEREAERLAAARGASAARVTYES